MAEAKQGSESHGTASQGSESHGTESHGTVSQGTASHGTESHQAVRKHFLAEIATAPDLTTLESLRVAALGTSGEITALLRGLRDLPRESRKEAGQALNSLKGEVEAALAEAKARLGAVANQAALQAERLDPTLPVDGLEVGHMHPTYRVMEEIISIFGGLGFEFVEGPDIDSTWNCFTALNIPAWHPARQEMDTFYIGTKETEEAEAAKQQAKAEDKTGDKAEDKSEDKTGNKADNKAQPKEVPDTERLVLRTHTSTAQVRTMLAAPPPYRVMTAGRAYRSDSDATHTPMFHQLEALVIDRDIHMGHLRGTIEMFLREFFEIDDLPVRFRASHFPFTEPSAEVDIGCRRTAERLEVGRFEDGEWLEILGSGMTHPAVLQNCGVDPDKWQGFAWGIGLERLAMLKYGAPDLRSFMEGDLDWLRRYGFVPLARASQIWGE